jgi:hypothetical protein
MARRLAKSPIAWILTWYPSAAHELARAVSVEALTRREPLIDGRSE